MTLRRPLCIAALTASASRRAARGTVATGDAAAAVTTQTPVMGPSLLTAEQLARVVPPAQRRQPRPALPGARTTTSHALAQIFIDEGSAEGVRGDIAFVQSMLETGWLRSPGFGRSDPTSYNYAGIYAFDGRARDDSPNCAHGDSAPSRCMRDAAARRARADPAAAQLRRPLARRPARTASIAAPSDRVGPRRSGSTSVGTTARAAS